MENSEREMSWLMVTNQCRVAPSREALPVSKPQRESRQRKSKSALTTGPQSQHQGS
jgi:hypothetical protein